MQSKEPKKIEGVSEKRYGYANSGIEVRFVECRDRDALAAYYAEMPGGRSFSKGEAPVAYSVTRYEPVFGEIITCASNNALITCTILIAMDLGTIDELEAEDERYRHLSHEIGHIAFDLCTWGADELSRVNGLPEPSRAVRTEIAAGVTEWLAAAMRHAFYAGPPVKSGLPFTLPWMNIGEDHV